MMKFSKGWIACMVVVSMYSCNKHEDIYKGPVDGEMNLTDLVVPADFDWKTSDDVKCNLTASASARVEVYTQENCASASKLASIYVDADTEPMNLVLARGIKEVYLRYMDREGKYDVRKIAVTNGEIRFDLPEGSRNFSTVPVKSNDKHSESSEFKMEGTVLFEDNYPVKGDYDFNDYVFTYDIEAEFDKNRKLEKIEVEIEFVAKGGLLPYEPYLCLSGIKYQLMKALIIDKEDTHKGVSVEAIKHLGNDNDLILKFTGVTEAMQQLKKEKSEYINTTKGQTSDKFVKLEFDIYFNGNEKYQGGDVFDFFLGGEINGQYQEIHEKNFASTRLMQNGKVEEGGYCTDDNFVWVMKIDENVYDDSREVGDYDVFPYLNEKDNFLNGYPKFRGYVENSGKDDFDWCKKKNRNENYLIFFED